MHSDGLRTFVTTTTRRKGGSGYDERRKVLEMLNYHARTTSTKQRAVLWWILPVVEMHHLDSSLTKSTITEVAQELMTLPFRHAYVRSSDEVGVLRTEDTFDPVSDETSDALLTLIQAQTRQKYCRPRAEVEKTSNGHQMTTNHIPAWR